MCERHVGPVRKWTSDLGQQPDKAGRLRGILNRRAIRVHPACEIQPDHGGDHAYVDNRHGLRPFVFKSPDLVPRHSRTTTDLVLAQPRGQTRVTNFRRNLGH